MSSSEVFNALATLARARVRVKIRAKGEAPFFPCKVVFVEANRDFDGSVSGVVQVISEVHSVNIGEKWTPDPIAPKPFTPNKYTRTLTALDGRKVPVDVYCVLDAFPTGSAAVDHAVKKQLAPGARGVKSRLQDLKEARDSLTRAIEIEEAKEQAEGSKG